MNDCVRYPEVGETGFYFVESAEIPMVNPLYGWDQGCLLIEPLLIEVLSMKLDDRLCDGGVRLLTRFA